MRKLILVLAVFIGMTACKTNPFTGQQVLTFSGNTQIFPMAFAQYAQFLTENAVIDDTADARLIETVGHRISSAPAR